MGIQKLTVAILLLLLLWQPAKAQPPYVIEGIPFKHVHVDRINFVPGESRTYYECQYGTAIFREDDPDLTKEQIQQITGVDVVYTLHPPDITDWGISFGKLMRARLNHLLRRAPGLRERIDSVRWRLVGQTGMRPGQTPYGFFHGVAFYYNDAQPAESGRAQHVPPPQYGKREVTEVRDEANYNTTPAEDIDKEKIPQAVKRTMDYVKRTIEGERQFTDSTAFSVFDRKKDWQNMLVVIDWTASMYEHGAQVINWHMKPENRGKLAHIAVFNDGDNYKRQAEAQRNPNLSTEGGIDMSGQDELPIGEAGGIYFASPEDFEEVIDVMQVAMTNGDGGYAPENDVEALLKAIGRFGNQSDRVVLIADNNADIRDIILAKRLTRPIDIVICARGGRPVNPEYIYLAWQTGGSVIIDDEELHFDKSQPQTSKSIEFMGTTYIQMDGGQFRKME